MNFRVVCACVLLSLLMSTADGCLKKTSKPDRPGNSATTEQPEVTGPTEYPDEEDKPSQKTVLYRLEAINRTHSTVTIKSNANSTLYENLSENNRHVYYRLLFGEEMPYSYVRVSTHEPDCLIIDYQHYIPHDGEFIIATVEKSQVYPVCSARIDMKLTWNLQIDLLSDPVSLPVAVDGELHVNTVEKPLMDIMQDLQEDRKFSFDTKSFGDLGHMLTVIDGIELPIKPGQQYSDYSFYLMKRMPGYGELCGLNLGITNYIPQHGDHIVIVIEQWKYFKYINCPSTISNIVKP